MTALLSPVLLKDRLPAPIPPEIQILAILFVFAALFLGVCDYYVRFWWWIWCCTERPDCFSGCWVFWSSVF